MMITATRSATRAACVRSSVASAPIAPTTPHPRRPSAHLALASAAATVAVPCATSPLLRHRRHQRRLSLRPAAATTTAAAAAAAAASLLPPQYGLVLASLASTAAMLQWMAIRVALARRQYGVAYPKMYADDGTEGGRVFDCTQRAHQNTLETAPAQMVLVALLGVAHPVPAAAAQAAWVGGRIAYALGYSTGDPKARLPGVAVSGLVYVGTIAAALTEGARMVLSGGA